MNIFISYSHLDKRWLDEKRDFALIPWLEKMLQKDDIALWYDRSDEKGIEAGDKFRQEIEHKIDESQCAILLVSEAFLNSDFIQSVEMPRIKAKVERGEMVVIPILLEPCDWENDEFFSARHMIPGEPTPLIDYTESDPKWIHVRADILKAIRRRVRKEPQEPREVIFPRGTVFKKYSKVKFRGVAAGTFVLMLTVLGILAVRAFRQPPITIQMTSPAIGKAIVAQYVKGGKASATVSGASSGVVSSPNLRVYLLTRLVEPSEANWQVQKEPVKVEKDGKWSAKIQISPDGDYLKSGDTFKVVAVVADKKTRMENLSDIKDLKELPEHVAKSSILEVELQFGRPPPQGNLRLSSIPLGAKVYVAPVEGEAYPQAVLIDRKNFRGLTPLSIDLEPGIYGIAFELSADKVDGRKEFEDEANFDSSYSLDRDGNVVKVARYYIIEIQEREEANLIGLFQPKDEPLDLFSRYLPPGKNYEFTDKSMETALTTYGIKDIPRTIEILHRGGKVVAGSEKNRYVIEMGVGKDNFTVGLLRD